MLNMAHERERMGDRQVERRSVHDTHVLDAIREVSREALVAKERMERVCEDASRTPGNNQFACSHPPVNPARSKPLRMHAQSRMRRQIMPLR